MGELRLPGLATGIDTAALIEQMMIINSRRLARYQLKQIDYKSQNTALDELRASVVALQSAAEGLSDIDDLEAFKASTSDSDILTVSASSAAAPGSHSVEIDQLATTEAWIQDVSTFDYESDYVGGGDFIYSYNHQESVITAVEDVTTLEDLVNLINNDENNPGVTASLLYQGGKYHLMLSGQETGEDYQISVNACTTEVWQADSALTLQSDNTQNAALTTKITELYQFDGSELEGGEVIVISGNDYYGHTIDPVEIEITSNMTINHVLDEIENVFDGNVKATLKNGIIVVTDKASGDSGLTVDIDYNAKGSGANMTLSDMNFTTVGGGASESLTLLGSASFIQTQNAQNSKVRIDGYTPTAVSEIQTMTPTPVPDSDTYTLIYDGHETDAIQYNATYAQIQAKLEELANVNTDDIVVSGAGADGLADGAVTFTFADTLGDVPMILIDDSGFTTPSVSVSVVETQKGASSWINRNSNSITDALTGITLNLHDVTAVNESVEITVTRDTGAIRSKVIRMASAYNQLMDVLAEKTEYNTDTKKMGILSNNLAVSLVKSQARDPFIGIIDGFKDTLDSFIQASDIGISIDGAGQMKFFTETFDEALNDDYMGVLEILGATKSGSSESDIVGFYAASDTYTTAGTYHVQVKITDNAIEWAKIKLADESTFRDATWVGNLITGDSTFNEDDGKPVCAENSLQLTVDLTQDNGIYGDETPLVVHVQQGCAGVLEDMLNDILKADGRIDTSKDIINDKITQMEKIIYNEENRLESIRDRLIDKYARLEKTLAMLQQQMGVVNMIAQVTFG